MTIVHMNATLQAINKENDGAGIDTVLGEREVRNRSKPKLERCGPKECPPVAHTTTEPCALTAQLGNELAASSGPSTAQRARPLPGLAAVASIDITSSSSAIVETFTELKYMGGLCDLI